MGNRYINLRSTTGHNSMIIVAWAIIDYPMLWLFIASTWVSVDLEEELMHLVPFVGGGPFSSLLESLSPVTAAACIERVAVLDHTVYS